MGKSRYNMIKPNLRTNFGELGEAKSKIEDQRSVDPNDVPINKIVQFYQG